MSVVQDTKAIILVTGACTLAATHACYCLQIRGSSSPLHAVYMAFLRVVRLGVFDESNLGEFEMLYGEDFNISEADDSDELAEDEPDFDFDYMWIHGLFHATRIGISILLMNLSIGVLGQKFELYQDQSSQLFQRARAKMLCELNRRPWRYLWKKNSISRWMPFTCTGACLMARISISWIFNAPGFQGACICTLLCSLFCCCSKQDHRAAATQVFEHGRYGKHGEQADRSRIWLI